MTVLVGGGGGPASRPGLAARLGAELRAASAIWRREVTHVVRDRVRAVVGLVQPLLFLFVLGVGLDQVLSTAASRTGGGVGYVLFLFPGVLVMTVQAPSLSAGASVVMDRHSGFLREMLVSPIGRVTLLLGKCAGGVSVALAQGAVVLAFAGLVGVPAYPALFVALLAEMALIAVALTAFSMLAAVLIRRMQTFNTFLTVVMTPSLFLSGMMFPIEALPVGLRELALFNPLTYGIDAMRRTMTTWSSEVPPPALFAPVSWGGWCPPVLAELGVLVLMTMVFLWGASLHFSRID